MKINNKSNLNRRDLITQNTVKQWFRRYAVAVIALAIVVCVGAPAFAEETDPIAVVNNLSDMVFALIRGVGVIILGWGIVQVGLSFQSHDASQRSNGFLTLAGGIVIFFAKEMSDVEIKPPGQRLKACPGHRVMYCIGTNCRCSGMVVEKSGCV